MIPEEFVRIITKNSTTPGELPTVPADETDLDSFLSTDIFEAELFYNIPDEKLYTRTGSTIVDLDKVCNPVVSSISTSTTVGNADIYEVTGTSSVVITLPNPPADDIIFKKMDSGGDVTFDQPIDGNATFDLTLQYECVAIANDGTDWIMTSYYNGSASI